MIAEMETQAAVQLAVPTTAQALQQMQLRQEPVLNNPAVQIRIPTGMEALKEFAVWLRMGHSATIIENTVHYVKRMLEWNHMENRPTNQLSEVHADLYVHATFRNTRPRLSTIQNRMKAMRIFFMWLNACGYHPRGIDRLLRLHVRDMTHQQLRPPTPKPLVKQEDIDKMLFYTESLWKHGKWLRFAVLWSHDGGLRMGDCATVQWDCIDLTKMVLTTYTRKSKAMIQVKITPRMLSVLPPRLHPEDIYVWPEYAQWYINNPTRVKAMVVKFMRHFQFGFHSLRHTFASNQAAAGNSLKVIGRWMGHRQESTTRRYVHEFEEEYTI